MKLSTLSIIILLSYSVGQKPKDADHLSLQVEKEYHNLELLFTSLNTAREKQSTDDATCLKPILRFGVPKTQRIVNHFKNLIYNESVKLYPDQQTRKTQRDLSDLNVTLHRLRDIHTLLNIATSTINYIRQDLNAELAKDRVQDGYDIESELKIECDTLKGILSTVAQLARRLVPPRIRQMAVPPRNPIIRVM